MIVCKCGKKMSRYSNECNACHKLKMDGFTAKARAIVATKQCPTCGAGLKRNLSIAGWWQCEQYGSEQFRKNATLPDCNFQTFTE